MEYLNNILSSGEISNLFARDELDEITGELVSVMKKQFPRRPPTQENLYNFFISRARKNLHVALCFSPVSVLDLEYMYVRRGIVAYASLGACTKVICEPLFLLHARNLLTVTHTCKSLFCCKLGQGAH